MRWKKKGSAEAAAAEEQVAREVAEKEQKEAREAQRKAKAEAERNEIFQLLRESKGGADVAVLKERRKSLSKEIPFIPEGARAQDRKLSPAALEAEAINQKLSKHGTKAASRDIDALLVTSPAQTQSRPRRRASTGDIKETPLGLVHRDVRALSTFANPATTQEKIGDVTAEVNRRLREKRAKDEEANLERLAKQEEEATLENEKKAHDAKGTRASAAVAKGRAKAMAKTAGGVFLDKREYDKLQARIKALEQHVGDLEAAKREGSAHGGSAQGGSAHGGSVHGGSVHGGSTFVRTLSTSFKSLSKSSPMFRRSASKKEIDVTVVARDAEIPSRLSSAYWNRTADEPYSDPRVDEAMRMLRWDGFGVAAQEATPA